MLQKNVAFGIAGAFLGAIVAACVGGGGSLQQGDPNRTDPEVTANGTVNPNGSVADDSNNNNNNNNGKGSTTPAPTLTVTGPTQTVAPPPPPAAPPVDAGN